MLCVYYDHQHKGNPCFRSRCDNPEYTGCLHPPARTVSEKNGIGFVLDLVHDDCKSCQRKVSQAVKKAMEPFCVVGRRHHG